MSPQPAPNVRPAETIAEAPAVSAAPISLRMPYLEHFPNPGEVAHRIPLETMPFHIGRCPSAHYVIYSRQVSKMHTAIFRGLDAFHIRDLGSTNGTFLNGQRIVEAPLSSGDIVHVARFEFRFVCPDGGEPNGDSMVLTESGACVPPPSVIEGSRHLRELLAEQQVTTLFQPIVWLHTREVFAYEALGRGTHPKLSPSPSDLFALADQCRQAPLLSRVFRATAMKEAVQLNPPALLFLNLHPKEILDEALLTSLDELRGRHGMDRRLVLEVHEDAIADAGRLRKLRDRLREVGAFLAYDDFGAGQSRLGDLAEAPPDFVKLDMKLVRNIEQARARLDLLAAIARVSTELGVQFVAEGIETAEEADACQQLGCRYGQGYLFGHPQPVSVLGVSKKSDTKRIDLAHLKQVIRAQQG